MRLGRARAGCGGWGPRDGAFLVVSRQPSPMAPLRPRPPPSSAATLRERMPRPRHSLLFWILVTAPRKPIRRHLSFGWEGEVRVGAFY